MDADDDERIENPDVSHASPTTSKPTRQHPTTLVSIVNSTDRSRGSPVSYDVSGR